MRSLPLRLLAASALLAGAAPLLPAQGEITVEFVSFPKKAEIPKLEVLVDREKTLQVELPAHTLSQPVKLPRLSSWQLGVSGQDAEGNFQFTPYGAVKPLAARKQVLVCLWKGKEPKDGISIVALDGSDQGFGEKKFMLMNLAAKEVVGELGDRKFRLPPAKHLIIQPKENKGPGLCFAELFAERKGKWRSFFSTNWPVLEESRAFVFIYQHPRNGTMTLHTIVDSLKVIPRPAAN